MIDKELVKKLVEERITGSDLYLVDVSVRTGNSIQVLIDNHEGISVEACAEVSRFLNDRIDREQEDYSLEVSSPGLGSPFRVRQQYVKHIGRDVEVLLLNGLKKKGKLLAVTGDHIEMETIEKAAVEGGGKKKKSQLVRTDIAMNEIKTTKAVISFK